MSSTTTISTEGWRGQAFTNPAWQTLRYSLCEGKELEESKARILGKIAGRNRKEITVRTNFKYIAQF